MTLADCLNISDVVISAVPSQSYKVPTKDLKDGCVCVNVAGEKNFETDVRERVSDLSPVYELGTVLMVGINLCTKCWNDDYCHAPAKSVCPPPSKVNSD
jgi:methylenetetrahydrofolate dehydrogenase (NAD+)